MLDPVTNEIIYASNGCEEIHESEDTGNEDATDDNNLESNLRRRKGKIISCAKETIEQGNCWHISITWKAFNLFFSFALTSVWQQKPNDFIVPYLFTLSVLEIEAAEKQQMCKIFKSILYGTFALSTAFPLLNT